MKFKVGDKIKFNRNNDKGTIYKVVNVGSDEAYTIIWAASYSNEIETSVVGKVRLETNYHKVEDEEML
jgi:hypothetical protein